MKWRNPLKAVSRRLKHASNVFGCAIEIENIIKGAGFPEHVFQTLLIGGADVDSVIENPLIKAVTLTGSTESGRKVAEKAASLIKKSVLELGIYGIKEFVNIKTVYIK